MHVRLAVRAPAIRPRTIPGLLAVLFTIGIDIFYVLLIHSQGLAGPVGPDWFRVVFLAGVLAAAALALAVGAVVRPPRLRVTLLGVGVLVCWVWAILAIFSIGLLLLAPGVLATVALFLAVAEAPRQHRLATSVLVWLVTCGTLAAGLYLTRPTSGDMHIICPKSGHLQGSETSNATTTRYRCDNGLLTKLP